MLNKVNAQQQAMFSQYMFNTLAINPAYAGSQESISLTALMREQWVGLEGAPSTQTFSAHSPFKEKRIGVGLIFLHDKIGVTHQSGVYASYAYKIPLRKGQLSWDFKEALHITMQNSARYHFLIQLSWLVM